MQLFPIRAVLDLHSPWLHYCQVARISVLHHTSSIDAGGYRYWLGQKLICIEKRGGSAVETKGGSIDAGGYRCNQMSTHPVYDYFLKPGVCVTSSGGLVVLTIVGPLFIDISLIIKCRAERDQTAIAVSLENYDW